MQSATTITEFIFLQMELIHILPGCPNTVITKGDDFFQVQEPSHDLMLHLVVMTL